MKLPFITARLTKSRNPGLEAREHVSQWNVSLPTTECYGTLTLHGNRNETGTGNRTGTIGDNGSGPFPGPGAV